MKREPITKKQQAIVDFLRKFTAKHSYPPSYDEMCAHFGVCRNVIVQQARVLEKKGYVRRTPKISRGMVAL